MCLFLGGQYVHEAMMNFTLQFMDQYKETSKFASVLFLEGDEHSMLRIKTMDADLREFLEKLRSKEPENTVIMLLSDQGKFSQCWIIYVQGNYESEYFLRTAEGKFEHKRPFYYLMVPNSLISNGKKYFFVKKIIFSKGSAIKHLTYNQENLVTAYDIHHTLKTLITGQNDTNKEHPVYDLFSETVPSSRTCLNANIPIGYCYCEPYDTHMAMLLFILLPIMILGWWAFTWFRKRIVKKKKKMPSTSNKTTPNL
jgi:hypothetical protein